MAMRQFVGHIKGLGLVLIIASICMLLGEIDWLANLGLGALTLSIILGIMVGNTIYPKIASDYENGVVFARSYILKMSIVLYGFHLTLAQISQVGVASIVADMTIVISTFGITYILGRRLFGLDQKTAILMGAGNSICGAAAILATESVVKAGGDRVAIAVAVVVIFGTAAIALYPAMYHLGLWSLTDSQWGLYIGSSVHEVAQVYAAGGAINPAVADIAVTTKMIRVMLLAPFLLYISFWMNRSNKVDNTAKNKIIIPWFAVAFILIAGFNSLNLLPKAVVYAIISFDDLLLAMAMVAVGLTTHISAIQKAGMKPILLGAIVMIWLVGAGGILQILLKA